MLLYLVVMSEDCYFYEDTSVPITHRKISVICVECRLSHDIPCAWFWDGSNQGYGPFDYVCCKCNKVIHKGKDDENEETEAAD